MSGRSVDVSGRGVRVAGRGVGVGVGSAIPDSGLKHQYDATTISASDGDAISTWTDQEQSDNLTQSTASDQPTLKTGQIGGNAVLRFDGSGDELDNTFTTINLPYDFYIVGEFQTSESGVGIIDGANANFEARFESNGGGDYQIYQGSSQTGSSVGTSSNIWTVIWQSSPSNDKLRINGTNDIDGDAGDSSLTGLTVGNPGGSANIDIGEILVYDSGAAGYSVSDVESYLSTKWGISI